MFNPIVKKITSSENPYIKYLMRLNSSRSFRHGQQQALVFGELLIRELQESISIVALLSSSEALLQRYTAPLYYHLTEALMKKIGALEATQSLAAVVKIPPAADLKKGCFWIASEGIQDPGNMGTLVRTALSFGLDGLILLSNSCDLFSDKTIRASRGAVFKLPYALFTLEKLATWAAESHCEILIADLEGEPLNKVEKKNKFILLLGTEGRGLSEEAKRLGSAVYIPTNASMPSLNVAIAAAILMYTLKP